MPLRIEEAAWTKTEYSPFINSVIMEKKYVKPAINVKEIEMENFIAASFGGNPTTGLPEGTLNPGNGGQSDGTPEPGAKPNTFTSVWDD